MIPPFNDAGYLPPGLHHATMGEIQTRFGTETEMRRHQFESLEWLVELVRRAGVLRLVINGSFVTDVPEPNDVDCVVLIGPGFPSDRQAEREIVAGLPYLQIEFAEQVAFWDFVGVVFASDRRMTPKGMIEVLL